jgi:hypothetical protein
MRVAMRERMISIMAQIQWWKSLGCVCFCILLTLAALRCHSSPPQSEVRRTRPGRESVL